MRPGRRAAAIAGAMLVAATAFGADRIPVAIPGATFDGLVTSVAGERISLGWGIITVDASQARISMLGDDKKGSIESIHPGDLISGIYDDSVFLRPGEALPALYIAVNDTATVEFTGIVEQISTHGLTVSGRAVAIDSHTRFDSWYAHTLSELRLAVGEKVTVNARNVNGRLAATYVGRTRTLPAIPGRQFLFARVRDFGPACWDVEDASSGKRARVLIDPATKLDITPAIGRQVDILLRSDGATAEEIGDFAVAQGLVTSVRGDTVSLLDGMLNIDRSRAKIQDDLAVGPGSLIQATYAVSDFDLNAPLPAMFVKGVGSSIARLGGRAQFTSSGIALAGRTATVDSKTRFSGYAHTLREIGPGREISVTAAPIQGRFVAEDVCADCYGSPPDITWLHGAVTHTSNRSWTVCDIVGRDFEVRVNSETNIAGAPHVGEPVDVIAHPSDATAAVIRRSFEPVRFAMRPTATRGRVQSISGNELRISSAGGFSAFNGRLYLQMGKVIGAPKAGDVVDVFGTPGEFVITLSPPHLPPMTVHGTMKTVSPGRMRDGRFERCEEFQVTPCSWVIAASDGDYELYSTKKTKIDLQSDSPAVVVTLVPDADGYFAQSIATDRAP